jgi:hypothetical protein
MKAHSNFQTSRRNLRCLCLFLMLQPAFAFAYIDPNAGGLLFQLLAPVFAALLAAWLFMRRVIADYARNLWRRLTGKADQ